MKRGMTITAKLNVRKRKEALPVAKRADLWYNGDARASSAGDYLRAMPAKTEYL